MGHRMRIGLLFGGRSAEHEVSLASARNVATAMDRNRYEILLLFIDREGSWGYVDDPGFLDAFCEGRALTPKVTRRLFVQPSQAGAPFLVSPEGEGPGSVDVIFPVLHGTFGEDGTLQGLLALCGIPFVGCGVLASAVGMDKDVMKRLFREAGIPTPRFTAFGWHQKDSIGFERVRDELGLPLFVKPANLGSSVGIRKVKDSKEFRNALGEAFLYDHKIVIEEFIDGREIECSVLGNEHPAASLPGEVIPQQEFYSYDAKYLDDAGALLRVPADLADSDARRVQDLAIRSYRTLCCEGMARVDFFLCPDGRLLVNELNTIPGFTSISMYPKLWEASGVSQASLIDRLIRLALERSERERSLRRSFTSP
jgi:D-alanine-D-alanine ligase